MYPFRQAKVGNLLLREFKESTDPADLIWHRDESDRIIKVIKGEGWQLQLEDSLPIPLVEGAIVHIPAGEYHRVIRGNSSLYILIHEAKDQNDDGENDGKDVRIARMKAGGMSDEKIKKEYPDLYEADKKKKKKKVNPAYLKGTRKSNKSMKREINKCAKEPRPKSCYDYWDADKKYDQAKKESEVPDLVELVEQYVAAVIDEAKKKKKSGSSKKLSKATKEKLNKIADKKGYTRGSVYTEYRKGLAAWLTGHRQGVTQHQWAMARADEATPSKPWASVKKKKGE